MEGIQGYNWDFIGVVITLCGVTLGAVAYLFSPYKKYFSHLNEQTKIAGKYNYYDFFERFEDMYLSWKEDRSPLAKKLQAKIDKLEEEKEQRDKEALSEIKAMVMNLKEDFQELKISCQR